MIKSAITIDTDDLLKAADYLRESAEHIQLYDLPSEESPFKHVKDVLRAKKDEMLALADRLTVYSKQGNLNG